MLTSDDVFHASSVLVVKDVVEIPEVLKSA